MIKEYIKLIKCYLYKLDPVDYTYEEVMKKIKQIKQQQLCDKYHMPLNTKFTYKLKKKLNNEYKKKLIKNNNNIKEKKNVLKKQIKKFKQTKKITDLEQIFYILLGVEKFKLIVLKLEDKITNKKQCMPGKYDLIESKFNVKNWNYHLPNKSRIDSLLDGKMNVLHNGKIHVCWLLFILSIDLLLLLLSSISLFPIIIFKIHTFTWLLKNIIDIYCVMLQRYNWIKLTDTINNYINHNNINIDHSFKTLYKKLKEYNINQICKYKELKDEYVKNDIETKENNLIATLTNEGIQGIIDYTKSHPEDKELILKILKDKLYGPKLNINIFEKIKQYNLNNKIITKDILTELYKEKIKESKQQFVCSRILYKDNKTKCASFNKNTHTIYYNYDNSIENAKKYYNKFVNYYKIDINENEFVNMFLIWILFHELDHVDKNYIINTHGEKYKLYLRIYKLDKYYRLIFNENELVSERIANTNATSNINKMIRNDLFDQNFKIFCSHQYNNIINNGYHFDKLIKCPIDKYFIKDTQEHILVKKLYGYKLTKEQYKDI